MEYVWAKHREDEPSHPYHCPSLRKVREVTLLDEGHALIHTVGEVVQISPKAQAWVLLPLR